jgi:type IV pilus assembly protein PilE
MQRCRSRQAFTLIELMVTVAIMGVLSAIAIPAFTMVIAQSKTAETSAHLSAMFRGAAAYYSAERSSQGNTATTAGYCTVADSIASPSNPKPNKQAFTADASFRAIGFNIAEVVYFSYGFATGGGVGACGHGPNDPTLYTFYANGDLDGDGIESTFEMAAGSDASNGMYHAIGLHIDKQTE